MKIHARNVENPKEILLFSPSDEKVRFYMNSQFFNKSLWNSDFLSKFCKKLGFLEFRAKHIQKTYRKA